MVDFFLLLCNILCKKKKTEIQKKSNFEHNTDSDKWRANQKLSLIYVQTDIVQIDTN